MIVFQIHYLNLLEQHLFLQKGQQIIVADFHAIEAVVLAYLANEEWRLEVFKTHGKIYEASASQIFHVPMDSIKKDLL